MADDTYYFTHDYNTRSDEKIKKLLRKYGYQGYGLWWAIIEDLYNNANALQTDYDGIAYDLHSDSETIKSIINDFGLFVIDDGYFGSLSVQKRIDKRNEKSNKARISAKKRWDNEKNMQTQCERIENLCEGNAIKERKGKENKVKDIKTYSEQSPEVELSKLLFSLMLKNNPIAKEPNIQKWAKNIDLMIRIDKRSIDDIKGAIIFSQQDSFWHTNILSTSKLREQFDKLLLKARSNGNGRNNQISGTRDMQSSTIEQISELFANN